MPDKYKNLIRTTLAETDKLPHEGVYVIAYMGKIIYVGQTHVGIATRLKGHWYNRDKELLGDWMDKVKADWINVRLDVLEPPDFASRYWMREVEALLITYFSPLFNTCLSS